MLLHHWLLLLPLLGIGLFFLLPLWLALPLYMLVLAVAGLVYLKVEEAQQQPPRTGEEAMLGARAKVVDVEGDQAAVAFDGETWRATSAQPLHPGETVVIRGISGLTLEVVPVRKKR